MTAEIITTVGSVPVWRVDGAVCFLAGMQINLDGAPNAYHPPTAEHPNTGCPPGLDYLGNAGKAGNWFGIVTEDGTNQGKPFIQGPDDPCPGFYVSQTALQDLTRPRSDPQRYVNSMAVPYIVLPSRAVRGGPSFLAMTGAGLGDLAVVMRGEARVAAIYGDVGPAGRLGEASPATAAALGIYRSPRAGHDPLDVTYVVFPGSAKDPAWPRDLVELSTTALGLFNAWSGRATLPNLFPGS